MPGEASKGMDPDISIWKPGNRVGDRRTLLLEYPSHMANDHTLHRLTSPIRNVEHGVEQRGMHRLKRMTALLAVLAFALDARAQIDLAPITQLLTDSIGVIGQAGQHAGFMIVQGDSVLYEQYWGTWDKDTYQPIASGSKMASMALIMRLIDEGYLSPDDTVQHVLPSFSGKPFITLHQLMNHTSGLPGVSPYITDNSYSLQQAVDSIGGKTPMTAFAPGTAFQYGGVSMHVAGRMAEIATGMRWDTLFRQKIAEPLGMTGTDYLGLGATTNFRIAGGVGTTMPDFARLLVMLLQYGRVDSTQVIDPMSIRMMQGDRTGGVPLIGTPYANDPLRKDLRYGYGIWVEEEAHGETTQFGSQGAFGFTPWVDRCRNIACVLFVRRTLGIIQPTHTQLRDLVEQIIPLKLQPPNITVQADQLASSYPAGNRWYFNDTLLPGETGQFLAPAQSGVYSVRHISEEGCEILSEGFYHAVSATSEERTGTALPLYPNPTGGILHVECPEGFQILGVAGSLVREGVQATDRIDVSDLPAGIYFLRTGDRFERFVKID